MTLQKEKGFSVVELLIILVVIGVVALVGLKVLNQNKGSGRNISEEAKNYPRVFWIDDLKGGWTPTREAPGCSAQVLEMSPVDTTKVTDWGFPGQWRGEFYKPHGLFALYRNNSSDIEVRLPLDSSLMGVTKYKEAPENDPQYLMEFQHECGMMIRFDHLNALAGDFKQYESLPTQNDTRGQPNETPLGYFEAGTLVATGAGLNKNTKGGGFDFGVYDLREPNEISKNAEWAALHKVEESHTFFARCWLEYLPKADFDRLMKIPPLYTDDRAASDYCDFAAGGQTLQYNGGQAVPDNGRTYRARE